MNRSLILLLGSLALTGRVLAAEAPDIQSNWKVGPWSDPAFFPLAVWLQSPANAERYRQAGINTYIGLWRGPTTEQLATLKQTGMWLICGQNSVALKDAASDRIIAWMHGDEPDNAQSLGEGKGWGPPIPPERIVKDYHQMREKDASRPIVLNLGQGVAWDQYYGRGVRSNHPEDYPRYIEGCDVVSFDIYPAVHDRPEVAGKLWYVACGVERLCQWSAGKKIVWNCLECTRISNPDRKPTPQEVRAEAWMSLIHGSHGLIYFVHQFKPTFREAALLDDSEMLEAVGALNRQITALAPVLNSPTVTGLASVQSDNESVPIATMTKQAGARSYLFSVAMKDGPVARVQFKLANLKGERSIEVIGENRSLTALDGVFEDSFNRWDAHVYRW